jgi:Tfp pilus assembly protein PilV
MSLKGICGKGRHTARLMAGVGLLLAGAAAALAQENVDNNSIFELEGNPQDAPSPTGEDWHKYFGTLHPMPPFPAGAAAAKTFAAETGNVTIFTQGGSKDVNGIGQWRHAAGSVPDKDDLQNGFAAAYNVNGELLLYFGADRSANNGDANIGFWFFQSNVGTNANGTFSGTHQDGDIFVVSGFTSGGQTSEIDVYKWSCPGNPANCDSTGSLVLITSSTAAQCVSSPTGSHVACAIANTGNVLSVWAYTPKQGTAGTFPVASFFEGGINVTALLGTTPCLSSFIVETRSSTSNTAQLKDFIRGEFQLCKLSATKDCPAPGTVNPGGTSIHYLFNGTVTNDTVGANNVTLVDTLPAGTVAGTAAFKKGTPAVPPAVPGPANTPAPIVSCPAGAPAGAVCADLGSLDGDAVVNWSVEFDSTSLSPQNNVFASASVSGATVTSDPASATCTAPVTNNVQITKNCGVPAGFINEGDPALPGTQLVTQSGLAAVQVNFSGTVCNTGQTPLTGVTLTDNPSATLTIDWPGTAGALAAAGQPGACANYAGDYLPTGVTPGDLGGAAGRYSFTDEIKVTGATATLGTSPGHDVTCMGEFLSDAQACGGATCNICPAGATCAGP